MKISRILLAVLGLLVLAIVLGPTPKDPNFSKHGDEPDWSFDDAVKLVAKANSNEQLKPGVEHLLVLQENEPTPYSILYLHGFSATPEEGAPTHQALSDTYGFNLYAPVLYAHGLNIDPPLEHYTALASWKSAVGAYLIARELGDSVIIVGTSTGCPLAIQLARRFPEVAAVIQYSPNVQPVDPNSTMLTWPWGEYIAEWVIGGHIRDVGIHNEYYDTYWDKYYSVSALPEMQKLITEAYNEDDLQKIKVPIYTGAWYESEDVKDDVVSVEKMHEMYAQLGTSVKKFDTFPAGTHIIANGTFSKSQPAVLDSTMSFLNQHLKLTVAVSDTAQTL